MSDQESQMRLRTVVTVTLVMVCGIVVSTDAQGQPPFSSPFAYTTFYCLGEACDYYPAQISGSVVVSPSGQSPGPYDGGPAWSPDASRIAYASSGDILVMDVITGTLVNITNNAANGWPPAWSPDGERIAYASDRDGQPELYLMKPDG